MKQLWEGKQVKKLTVGVILAVLLILLAVTAAASDGVNGVKYWEAENTDIGSPLDMAILDGKVYLTTEDGFFEWNPETEETTELNGLGTQAVWSSLFVRDGELMMLGKPGKLWRFDDDNWELECDYAKTPLAEYAGKKSNLVYCRDSILILGNNEEGTSQNLMKLNLLNGSVQVLHEGNVLRLCYYRNGQILAVLIVDEETEKLVVMDAETGEITQELTQMHLFSMKGLAYDEQNDRIYAVVDGALSMWNGEDWQCICQTALPWLAHSHAVLGDLYLAASHVGIQSISLDVQQPQEQRVLSISGVTPLHGSIDHSFQEIHGNAAVARRTQNSMSAQDAASAIRNGDETDLFYVRMDASWPELLHSGLLEPVHSEELMKHSEQMADLFRELAFADEKLYAVITDCSITAWTQNAMQIPATYGELLSKKYDGLTWDYQLWQEQDYIDHLIRQQIRESGGAFDTPSFRLTLEAMRQNGLEKRSQPLFSTARSYMMGNLFEVKGYAAPLRIDQSCPIHYPVTLYLYIVNPNSQQQELAIEFLEYTVSRMDAETHAMLCPDQAQPELLPFAEEWIERVKKEHAQDVKDGILPDDPAALEERIENLRNMPGHQLVTQEQLDFYRKIIYPNLEPDLHPLLSEQNREARRHMMEIIKQYLQNEISLDETIRMLTNTAESAIR